MIECRYQIQGLISKNSTPNRGGRTKPPKVFTEQGIYMLLTVLKGEKVTVQSKALIRTFKADLAFAEIYSQANNSIYIVDNYISIKTLEHFVGCDPNVQIFIFSDNVRGGLRASVFSYFCREYPYLNIQLIHTCGKFHDRYIILDYEQESEKIYLCGASSKDAGARITSITEFVSTNLLKPVVDSLLKNPVLVLK